MAGHVDLKDFVAGFLLEAEEHLHSANRNLVATAAALKKGLPEPRAVRELFRSLHTIKGLSAMVGAEPIVEISHEMEGLLRAADRAGGRLSESTLDLILQGNRAIEERVRNIPRTGIAGILAVPKSLVESLALAQRGSAVAPVNAQTALDLPEEISRVLSVSDREQLIQGARAGSRVIFLEFQPSPKNSALGINITTVRERLAKLGELVKVVPRSSAGSPTGIAFGLLLVTSAEDNAVTDAVGGDEGTLRVVTVAAAEPSVADAGSAAGLESGPDAEPESQEWLSTEQSSIRVDVRRLDESLEQLSSLFVTRFKLERVAAGLTAQGVDTRDLKAVLAENTRQLRRLRTAISEARMVPLSELLQRLPLVVRGITRESQKSVNVTINAGSAEVDKAVADKVFPAVVHLVRNAVDHAIETREERRAAGKNEVGELTITCDDSSGTNLVLTVTDDGRGVDRESVARKLGRPVARDDNELLDQICSAGLSTSTKLTHTSGRGMGMDIVKRTVEVLGGTLALHTEEGKGSTLTLRVPVTVTIVDVFSFVSAGQVFVAPVAIVDEIVEVDRATTVDVPVPHLTGPQPRLLQHRGKAIPLFSLEGVLQGRSESSFPLRAMVVNQRRGAIAFGVDRMIGQQEAVVRPIDDSLVRVTGMAGATDLGDGKPTLVLDLATLGASLLVREGVSPQ